MPILKGRDGEFKAVAQVSGDAVSRIVPIFEVAPTGRGPTKDAYAFAQKAQASVPRDMTIGVDISYLDDPFDGPRRPARDIADDLGAWGIPILPVVHLQDSDDLLADAGDAASGHSGHAVVRLGSDTVDPDDEEAEAQLNRLQRCTGLPVENYSLLIDVFEVRSERDVTRVEPVVRKCVSWARQYPWHSITLASGAMPASISDLPTNTATPVRRWDLLLWQRVRELGLQYGDYGIAHPRMTRGGWRPMPNLRYAHDEAWWIYRWTMENNDNTAIYRLCEALVAADHWPSQGQAYSWGDAEIAQRAAGLGGPGNATSWRAWATSHHVAHVVDQLGGNCADQ
ncbi:beta family protein [Actinoplanes sp. NPDC051633]|uniref:beta family protein n=1 Tax=Actinoplanes sp. NPDC051633 TaxID=3155670 RepID=UPI0034285B30